MLLIKIILVVFSFSVNSYIVPAFFVVLRGHLNPRSYVRKMQTILQFARNYLQKRFTPYHPIFIISFSSKLE